MRSYLIINSPVGNLTLTDEDNRLTGLSFGAIAPFGATNRITPIIEETANQLKQYFEGARKKFDIPISFETVSRFSSEVLKFLLTVPYGETATYSDAAAFAGQTKAVRAAGRAISRNPIAIIIPCHRIIGKNGSLTGFNGGLEIKKFLLTLEGIPFI